jgi:hypothetical protein
MTSDSHRVLRGGIAAAITFALAACATASPDKPAAVAAGPLASSAAASTKPELPGAKPAGGAPTNGQATAAPTAPRPGEPPPPRPFADVIKEAKETKGFFTVWRKDERTWLEIRPDQLDQPFFFGNSLASGLGERFFLPGLMGLEHVVVLRRVGNNVQLIAKNLRVRAPSGTPLDGAIRESYSDSLLAAAPVVSAPHAERKSFLVDAAALLLGDLPGAQTALETAYRMAFALDRSNSSIERVRTTDEGTFVTVRAHFSVPKLPAPPRPAPGAPPPNPATLPNPPQTVPDPRSLFLSFAYTLAPLPAEPMRPRLADQRVGHFTEAFWDFGNEAGGDARTHFVNRWRLEKKNPAATTSEPRQPILVWMDKNIPEKWRDAVRAGILEWNKAFERAGFKDAIVVKQQPADADWSTVEGTRHLAVRWFAMQGPGAVAVGPSQVDPRTGEILRGAAIIPENWVRFSRTSIGEQLPKPQAAASVAELLGDRACTFAFDALDQMNFGLDLLVARGAIDPNGPEADRFVADSLKEVVMHEVGHALGLRHNFKASTGVKLDQLRDAAFVRSHGVSNSVMDYNALNIPLESEPATVYNQTTIGAYDYWAIEYAYRAVDPAREKDELAAIAGRAANDPALAYATDEDAGGFFGEGIDPTVNPFDLGSDPLAYYQRRFALTRELWRRTQQRELPAGDSFALYRRNLARGLRQIQATAPLIAKYVGGVYTTRVTDGPERPLLVPVPADKQRDALNLLAKEVLSVDSFRFDPKFMSRLGIDQLDRFMSRDHVVVNTDFSLATSVLAIQRSVLDQLMSDGVAQRLADAETKVNDRRRLLTLADVQHTLADAVWSEVRSGRDVDSLRRNLQREHVKRLASGLVRPASAVAADVRSVQRATAIRLEADLRRALGNRKLSAATRAHLAESQALLAEALKAPLVRQGV